VLTASPLDFLPVRVVSAPDARSSTAGPIEIVLPNGWIVRVGIPLHAANVCVTC